VQVPLIYTSPTQAAAILGISTKALQKRIKALQKESTNPGTTLQSTIAVQAKRKTEMVSTENVLGYLEGTDKKDELLVVTAHYDHIGINPLLEGDQINNGADDDGSGTVAVMELAEAFVQAKKDGHGPRRSILFMTVTGEEKGLLGSQYYSENPVFPLASTVANLNIDMIGRVDDKHQNNPNYIYLIGTDMLSSELHQLSEETAKTYAPNLEIDYTYNDKDDPNRFYYRSDHYNFAKHNIPVIFYFNGTHEDYHGPGDEVEKIHFEKMEAISRLIFATAWKIANREERLVVDKLVEE
jgi:Zn-dependent M28 family amino/carboxypeptidase